MHGADADLAKTEQARPGIVMSLFILVLVHSHRVVMQIIRRNPGIGFGSVWLVAIAICVTGPLAAQQPADRIVLLDGSAVANGQVIAINTEGQLIINGHDGKIDLQGLRRIERPSSAKTTTQVGFVVMLQGGGELNAKTLSITDEVCQIDWAYGQKVKLPIDLIRAIRVVTPISDGVSRSTLKGTENYEEALGADEGSRDRLFVIVDRRLQSITGLTVALTDQKLSFRWQNKTRHVSLEKVYGVVLARTGKRSDRIGQCYIHMSDGSSIWARVLKLADDRLELRLSENIQMQVPWPSVTKLEVRSDRMVFLSDLEPSQVVQRAVATYPWPWQADKSVFGNALKLRGKTYEKGLGTHAESQLEFQTRDKFDTFAAVIGIDDETHGKGDCVFLVLGDGKELFKQRIKGKDKAVEVRVSIKGVSSVRLIVQPGADWDFGDHADWCDARFIRQP